MSTSVCTSRTLTPLYPRARERTVQAMIARTAASSCGSPTPLAWLRSICSWASAGSWVSGTIVYRSPTPVLRPYTGEPDRNTVGSSRWVRSIARMARSSSATGAPWAMATISRIEVGAEPSRTVSVSMTVPSPVPIMPQTQPRSARTRGRSTGGAATGRDWPG